MSLSQPRLLSYARRRKLTIPEVEDAKVLQPSQPLAAVTAAIVPDSGRVYSEPMEENLEESSDTIPTDHNAGNPGAVVRESESELLVDSAMARETILVSDKLVDSEGLPATEEVVGASEFVTSGSNSGSNAAETETPQDKQPQMGLDLRGLACCGGKAFFDLNKGLQKDTKCRDEYHENPGLQGEVLGPHCRVVSNMVVGESEKLSDGGASGDSQRSDMESPCHESHVTQDELKTGNTSSHPNDERLIDEDSKGAESGPHCERNTPFDRNVSLQKDDECGFENLVPQVEFLDPESECKDVSTTVVEEGVLQSRKLSYGASCDPQRSSMGSPCHESHVAQPEVGASPSEGLHSDNIGVGSIVQAHDERPIMEVDLRGEESSPLCERNFPLNDTLKKGDECVDGHDKNLGVGAVVLKPESHVISTMVVAEGIPESRNLSDDASGDSQRLSMESSFPESLVTQPEVRASQSDCLHSDNISIASTSQPHDERPMDLDSRGPDRSPHFERNPLVDLNDAFQKDDECGDGYSKNVGTEIEVPKPECHVVSTMVVVERVPQSRQLTDGGVSDDSQRSSKESPCHGTLVPRPDVRASHSESVYSATIGTASTGQSHDEQPVDVDSRGAENNTHCGRNVPLDLNDAMEKGDECGNGHNENRVAQVEVLEPECHNVSIMVVEQRVPESRKLSGGASSDSQRSYVGSLCHESHGTHPEARASKSEGLHSIATAITSQPIIQQPMVLDTGGAENSPQCKRNVPVDMSDALQKGDECGDGYKESLRARVGVLLPECHDVSTMVVAEGVQESRKLSYGSLGDPQRSSVDSPCHESHVTQLEVRASHSESQPQDWPIGTCSEAGMSSLRCNKMFSLDATDSLNKEDQSGDDYYDSLGAPIHDSGTGEEIPLPRVPQHFMGMKDGHPCCLPIGNHLEEAIDDLPPGVQRGPRGYLRGVWDYAMKAAHQARANSLEASLAQKRVRELESQVQSLNQLMEDWKRKALDVMERSHCKGSDIAPIIILPVTQTGLPGGPCHRLALASTSTGAPSTSPATVFTPTKNPLFENTRGTPPSRPDISMWLSPSSASPMVMNSRAQPSSVQHLRTSTDAIRNCNLPPSTGVSGSNTSNVQKPRHVRRVRFEGLDGNDANAMVGIFHVPKKKRTHDYSSPSGKSPPLR
ncbi:unnamed protein product [Linum tenue]|uniref:Remorin C-terminal domain-containing protein n=1 Tax=Linum tenue TaxID=586396 RepID=A0AAV0JD35_9ROSI|nr:unnamed protein product [Linum tenue]